jgi:hypothetical protein
MADATTGLGALAAVSGLSVDDVKGIWEEVKLNAKKLEACGGPHAFGALVAGQRRYVCSKCGGGVNANARYWYEQGLVHGRV